MTCLRGNTFLLLLLREGKSELYDHPEFGESKDGITRPNMLADLIRLTNPGYEPKNMKSLGVYFSQYLSGDKPNSTTYFPFNKPAYRDGLNDRLQSKRGSVLRQMDAFCRKYLTMSNMSNKALVASLIDAVMEDQSFEGTIDTGYKTVERVDLGSETDFILQPFLVSIWNDILMNHPDAAEGTQTYNDWTNNKGFNAPTDVVTELGRKRIPKISVSTELPEIEDDADDDSEVSSVSDAAPFSGDNADDGHIDDEASNASDDDSDETFDHNENKGASDPDDDIEDNIENDFEDTIKSQTLINKGKIVNQHAKTIYNIGHIDTFNG